MYHNTKCICSSRSAFIRLTSNPATTTSVWWFQETCMSSVSQTNWNKRVEADMHMMKNDPHRVIKNILLWWYTHSNKHLVQYMIRKHHPPLRFLHIWIIYIILILLEYIFNMIFVHRNIQSNQWIWNLNFNPVLIRIFN